MIGGSRLADPWTWPNVDDALSPSELVDNGPNDSFPRVRGHREEDALLGPDEVFAKGEQRLCAFFHSRDGFQVLYDHDAFANTLHALAALDRVSNVHQDVSRITSAALMATTLTPFPCQRKVAAFNRCVLLEPDGPTSRVRPPIGARPDTRFK
ncbi:MAG: hypothetical protein IT381_25200 [Deltaproteobacteria bacterium]|nr:hypothetical protein [Deltaproteobacteria bacterium]